MQPTTSTTTAAQRGAVLAVPAPAANETLRVDMVPGSEVQLPFEPGQTTVSRSENSLVFELDNGGTVTINNFFVTATGEDLPTLILPQGEEVPAAIAFADSGLDLTTAAGPAASSPSSSGSGEYADSAGDLIGGLDRLGSLNTDHWGRSTEAPEYQQSALTVAGAVTDGSGAPDDPVGPVGPLAYIARGVMYTQNEDTLPELKVDLLSVAGGSASKYASGSAPADANLVFFDENGDPIADPMGWSYVDGKIIFTNPPAAGGIFYVTITDSNGNTYSMQIVITDDKHFDSQAQDAATPPAGGGLAHGEWHSGKDTDNTSDYDTTSSNLDDEMTFTGDIVGGKINTGHAANRAWGDDSVTVHGNVDKTDMDFGSGTGMLDIKNSLRASEGSSTITMAHGTIDINADKTGGQYGIYAAGDGKDVTIIGGDTTVRIGAGTDKAGGSAAYGVFAGKGGDVSIDAGSVTIDAEGRGALGIYADGGSTVEVTAEDVTINAKGEANASWARGMQASGQNSAITIHSTGGEVSVSAYGREGYAMSAEGLNNKTRIDGAEKVTLKASHTGMSANSGNASNTIDGGEVRIIVDEASVAGHGGMYASEAKNIIQNATSVTIDALGGKSNTGMNAGYKGENTVTSTGDVTVTAKDGTSTNYGLSAAAGSNSITTSNGDVKITATGKATENIGIRASQGGTTDITAVNGNVTIDSTGSGFGKGIFASGASTVNINAHDVSIKTDGSLASQGSNALRNDGSTININSSGGTVTLEAGSGPSGWHAGMLAMNSGTSKISGAKETVITAKDDGMSAAGGTNIIDGTNIAGDSVRINAGGAMYANGPALNKILNVDNVYMGSETQRANTGMNVYNTGENRVENAKHVEIYAKSSGMVTSGGYSQGAANSITANDVTIDVKNAAGVARGMMATEMWASNSITAKDVTINANGTAVQNNITVGMHAQSRASNTITSDGGAVSVTARGGESYGMYTNGGTPNTADTFPGAVLSSNLIQGASQVTVAADNIGMAANRGRNTIRDITAAEPGEKAVEIIADGTAANGRSGMYAQNFQGNSFDTISENRIENVVRGNVLVTASGAGGANAAMNAYTYSQPKGDGVARNIITGVKDGDVTLTAENGDTNYAMRAFAATGSNTTENIIDGVSGAVTLKASGGTESHGMSASGKSASNTINNAGSVDITAETSTNAYGTKTYGMLAQTGDNRIDTVAGDVNIVAKGAYNNTAMSATGPTATQFGSNTISNVEGTVNLTATGKSATGMFTGRLSYPDYTYGGTNTIEHVRGSVNITASGIGSDTSASGPGLSYGMRVDAANGKNIINDVDGQVKVVAKSVSPEGGFPSQATGLYAFMGENRITGVTHDGDYAVDISATGGYATGIHADYTNTSGIKGVNTIGGSGADAINGNLRVAAEGISSATALLASGGENSITVNGNAEFIAKTQDGKEGWGNRMGVQTAGGKNIVTATGDILIKAEGGNNSTSAVHAEGGLNKITAGGDLTISATGNTNAPAGYENNAMFARSGGVNEVSGKNIYITGDIRTYMYDAGGTNRILGTDEDNRLVLNGNIDTNRGSLGTVGSATIDLGAGHNTAVINGTVSASGAGATNTIKNVSDLTITSTSSGTAYALQAHGGAHNIIDNRLVVGEGPVGIIITASGAAKSYALYANGAGSTNEIYGSLTNANNIELRGDIYAANGGKNILKTGDGDDHIMIDGKVTGDFQFDAGGGYNTLELRAASWDDFTARYGTWLSANFNDMHIESLQWILGDSTGTVPGWLIDLVNSYNDAHPGAPLDVDYAALGIAPPVAASAHSGSAEAHTDTASANAANSGGGHTESTPSADAAPQHSASAGDAGDANAAAYADNASNHTADSSGGHASDAPPAGDASQHGPAAGDASDANAAAHDQSNLNPEHESTLDAIIHTDENGHAVNNHVDHNGDATHDVTFGSGDDTVQIHGDIDGTETGKVDIDLGDGHNTLVVDGAVTHAAITGGNDGNDISIHGALDGHITLGDGADHVDLGTMQGGAVDLGAGDDTLTLHGFTGGLLDGGAGDDTLILTLDGLGGNHAFESGGAFSGLFEEGAVKGFENLVLDMTGDSEDSLDMGALLSSLKGLGGGEDLTVRITGDANDHVDTKTLTDAGWTCQDNGDGTSHWTSADEATLTIIIQNGL